MPAPKSLKDQVAELLDTVGGSLAIERSIRQGLRARGHDPVEALPLIRQHIHEKFAWSHDGKQAWGIYQGRAVQAGEAVRQAINAITIRLETMEADAASHELAPVETVQESLKRSVGYSLP